MPVVNDTTSLPDIQFAGRLLVALLFPDEESWAPLVGMPGYRVSSLGRVQSSRVTGKGNKHGVKKTRPWADIKPSWCANYLGFTLYPDSKKKTYYVHKEVMKAFVGPRPQGMVVRHLDDDPANNRLRNLAFGSVQDNIDDRTRNGNCARGSRVASAKLNEEKVVEILAMLASGVSQKSIARRFGVGDTTVWLIHSGKYWKHVPRPAMS